MKLSPKKRAALRMMFGGKCAYCGNDLPEKGWHADHVKPVVRKVRWDRTLGKYIQTGEMWRGENDTEENLFPACRACNIDKSRWNLENWRKLRIERLVEMLRNNYSAFRHAERFGFVAVTQEPFLFWFEKYRAQQEDAERQGEANEDDDSDSAARLAGTDGRDGNPEGAGPNGDREGDRAEPRGCGEGESSL